MSTTFTVISADNLQLSVRIWKPEVEARALLLISHGMGEHSLRYDEFARYMNRAGFIVAAPDHRGHGQTAANKDELGYFSIEKGWEKVVDDLDSVKDILENEYTGLPFFVLGHSMGSFVVRDMLAHSGEGVTGTILSGSSYVPKITVALLNFIASREIAKYGDRYRSIRLDKMSFANYNKQFKPNRTRADWLSRNMQKVDQYLADPLCGFVSTCGFYQDLSRGLKKIINPQYLADTPKDMSLLIYSGSRDPLAKGISSLEKLYKKVGLKKIDLKLNPEGRHESLNETNRQEVFQIFRDFYLSLI